MTAPPPPPKKLNTPCIVNYKNTITAARTVLQTSATANIHSTNAQRTSHIKIKLIKTVSEQRNTLAVTEKHLEHFGKRSNVKSLQHQTGWQATVLFNVSMFWRRHAVSREDEMPRSRFQGQALHVSITLTTTTQHCSSPGSGAVRWVQMVQWNGASNL